MCLYICKYMYVYICIYTSISYIYIRTSMCIYLICIAYAYVYNCRRYKPSHTHAIKLYVHTDMFTRTHF